MAVFFGKGQNLPLALFLAGGFIAGYSALQRSEVPIPTEADIDNYIEAKYIIEHERMQNSAEREFTMSPEWERKHKAALREEAIRPSEQRLKETETMMGLGLIMLVLGTGGLVARFFHPNQHS